MRSCLCLLVFAAYLTAAPVPPPKASRAPSRTYFLEDRDKATHKLTVSPGGKVTAVPLWERSRRWEGTWHQRGLHLTVTIRASGATPTKEMKFRLVGDTWEGHDGSPAKRVMLILTPSQANERADERGWPEALKEEKKRQRVTEQHRRAKEEEKKRGRR
jgi:hypothetical protein